MGLDQTSHLPKYKQIMSLANFNGNWEQTEKGANFKDFLAALGVGMLKRNIANNMGRTITFEAIDDKNFHVISKSKLKTNDKKFCLGLSQDGKRDDDMECTTVFNFVDGKIVQDLSTKNFSCLGLLLVISTPPFTIQKVFIRPPLCAGISKF